MGSNPADRGRQIGGVVHGRLRGPGLAHKRAIVGRLLDARRAKPASAAPLVGVRCCNARPPAAALGCPDGGPSERAARHDARAGARLRAAQCVPHAQSFGFRGLGLRASSHRDSVRGVACVPRRAPCPRGTGGVVGVQAEVPFLIVRKQRYPRSHGARSADSAGCWLHRVAAAARHLAGWPGDRGCNNQGGERSGH